ncbi:hypothetical protein K437DRAFT_276897 [Tilletiaria anomala UBC 951]|uniref:HTH APSES-type domain-containing protein n=1 Tax=Tilletiaria anomala (strain ATCC 24038 / CBS 436.72 / UBC 951) TaxID=1037660 RepID=A0A066V3L4_TILAU|nr:uncharacterized protein K437DRAFT_276897 [Tilletiaria anomala UBC 951]KDN36051.1 hypothetical protein K437DRAFT_276897 [Tilletiaria anomala UBC 951]
MPPKNIVEGQIFKATYSGVPVYECIIKGVAVMRRRADGWLNATQILKVVGLDKPQRTRVLEREVQKNTHEKVQGGYGKYQGTWIPLESAIKLGQQYNIQLLLEPLTSYVPSAESPPPAPKHTVQSANRIKKGPSAVEISALARARRETSLNSDSDDDDSATLGLPGGAGVAAAGAAGSGGARRRAASEGSMSPSPSDVSSSSRTPSPIATARPNVPEYYQEGRPPNGSAAAAAGGGSGFAPGSRGVIPYGQDAYDRVAGYGVRDDDGLSRYAEIILDYFISESTTIPPLLINPPPDFDANMSIDDDEHTALHWACAMGRIRVVKLLLSAGADVFRVNTNGQTALMRAAMFSNNYDLRKFPELFELLHRSILNIDRNDRTVFHHVVDLALSRGKPHAARYYLETMVTRLSEYGSQLADMLNFQDDEGETPLTMAARARSKRLVRLLLEYGADPKIRNKEGKNAEDYIIEDERFRASPGRTSAAAAAVAALAAGGPGTGGNGSVPVAALCGLDGSGGAGATSLHTSEAGQRAGGRAVQLMAKLLHQLADSYDAELGSADKRLSQAASLLVQIQAEVRESDQVRQALQREADDGDREKDALAQLEAELRTSIAKRHADDMARSWDTAQDHVKRLRIVNGLPEDALFSSSAAAGGQGASGGDSEQKGPASAQDLLAPVAAGKPLQEQLAELRQLVSDAKARHSALVDQFVAKAKEQGTGKTMAAYRRLISAGCGGIASEEVDAVVTALCDLLDENGSGKCAAPGGGSSCADGTGNAQTQAAAGAKDAAAMLRGVAAASSNH